MLQNLGQAVDLVIAMCDPLRKSEHHQLPLFWEPVCCAMSIYHPLARKDHLEISDLFGQTLMLVARKRNSYIDKMRKDLEENRPQIFLSNFTYFNMDTFNTCGQSSSLMMAIGRWRDIHPQIRILPVNWPYKIPYGLHYSAYPSYQVREFVRAAQESFSQGGLYQ